MLFHFKTKVRFMVGDDLIDREIVVDSKQHDFYFRLPDEPNVVRFDPDYGLLTNIKFDKPTAMLYEQLDNHDDVIGRLRALDSLKKKKDQKTVEKLKDILNNDPFYAVRRNASSALREIHTYEAFEALADSLIQVDARVRQQVVRDLSSFYRSETLTLLKRTLRNEKNPAILEVAIRNLGLYQHKSTRRLILKYLKSVSFRNGLTASAIEAIRMLDEPFFIVPLQKVLDEREMDFRSWSFTRGLSTLAHISRNEDDKTKVRNFLAGYVNHPKDRIQAGAIGALGTLGDPKAIPIIETFSNDEPDDNIERSAERALKQLRERKPLVPDEIVHLRETVDEFRKETDKLKDELDDIKKRLDAKDKAAENKDNNKTTESSSGTAEKEKD
jgi:aminopeptidase N